MYLELGEIYFGEVNIDFVYGNIDFIVGGSVILVMDFNGYYGVEFNIIILVDSDILLNVKFIEGFEILGCMVFYINNGDVNFVVRYYFDIKVDVLSIWE